MCQHPLLWKLNQKFVKYAYAYSTRRLSDEDELLLNFAYDADPPMGLQSEATDERNRGCIQLYYATASQVDLAGKKVLEVGRGYGGGVSYTKRVISAEHDTRRRPRLRIAALPGIKRGKHYLPNYSFIKDQSIISSDPDLECVTSQHIRGPESLTGSASPKARSSG
jgi:hypothetical protein